MDEQWYKDLLKQKLASSFVVREEVEGVFAIAGLRVIVDFVLYPSESLISEGFPPIPFGVEVKSPVSRNSEAKCIDAIWQSSTYVLSEYNGINLAFVLLFPGVIEFLFSENPSKFKRKFDDIEVRTKYHTLNRLMQRANVGTLEIDDHDWKISFGSARFFSSKRGKGEVKNLGMVRRVGNRKLMYDIERHKWCTT